MPSKMRRYGTAGRPGVPGGFSGPSSGAIRLHNSSGVCHIVSNEVSVVVTFLLQRDEQGKYMLPRPRFQVFGQILIKTESGQATWPKKGGLMPRSSVTIRGSSVFLTSGCRK